MPIFTVPIHEANDCHLPAGSPAGGQFCSDASIHGEGAGTYTVRSGAREIGRANVADDGRGDYLTSVRIDPEFRRQGLATRLYNYIEHDLGRTLRPSPTYRTPDSEAFWQARQGDADPPAVGPRKGFVTPQGRDRPVRPTGGLGGYEEDHTDMARRLLGSLDAGNRDLLKQGYVRYWAKSSELALNFMAGNEQASRAALRFLKDNFEPGQRIYLDIEGTKGVQLGKFFDNLRQANETIRFAAKMKAA